MDKFSKIHKKTYLYVPIFGVNGNVFFNKKKYTKFCKNYHGYKITYNLGSGICLFDDKKFEFVIGIFDNSKGTLAHEIVHLTQWILKECNIDSTKDDGETMAYLTKYLFDKIEERMK